VSNSRWPEPYFLSHIIHLVSCARAISSHHRDLPSSVSQRKIDPHIEARGHTTRPSPPAVSAPAAPALVADTRRYLGPAQWLYLARLPSPHDTRPWCASTPLSHPYLIPI